MSFPLVLSYYTTYMLIPKQPSHVSRVLRVEDYEQFHYPDEYPLYHDPLYLPELFVNLYDDEELFCGCEPS